ncbi:hypothetical protein DB30_04491 [Enhygromyxa salina]|uniref:Uncharacterized protein n=1 Tax=Enhygromyxa salina TaxID=215803 RepID=A0A0C2D8Z1_9BACT|nr:hypothetical protein DB30_04491 [Enhygromyxa salina]
MLACDSAWIDVVLGERCRCTCATTRKQAQLSTDASIRTTTASIECNLRNQHCWTPRRPSIPSA